jgi:hypothetical protein
MGLPRYGIEPRQEGHKVDDLEDAVAFAIFTAHTGVALTSFGVHAC